MTDAENLIETLKFMSGNEELKQEQNCNIMAKQMRQLYLANMKAGFTAKQSMELVKHVISMAVMGK